MIAERLSSALNSYKEGEVVTIFKNRFEPSAAEKKRLVEFGSIFRVDPWKCYFAWIAASASDPRDFDEVCALNMNRIIDVDTLRPGASNYLHTEFGIRNFSRFSVETLVRQFDERENLGESMITICSTIDGDRALEYSLDAYEQISRNAYNVGLVARFAEAQSVYELFRLRRRLQKKYNPDGKNPWRAVYFDSHGLETQMHWGPSFSSKSHTIKSKYLDSQKWNDRSLALMRTEIANDGVIILGSCHAGLDDEEGEKSVAQHIANLTHRKVIAARGLMMPFDTVHIVRNPMGG